MLVGDVGRLSPGGRIPPLREPARELPQNDILTREVVSVSNLFLAERRSKARLSKAAAIAAERFVGNRSIRQLRQREDEEKRFRVQCRNAALAVRGYWKVIEVISLTRLKTRLCEELRREKEVRQQELVSAASDFAEAISTGLKFWRDGRDPKMIRTQQTEAFFDAMGPSTTKGSESVDKSPAQPRDKEAGVRSDDEEVGNDVVSHSDAWSEQEKEDLEFEDEMESDASSDVDIDTLKAEADLDVNELLEKLKNQDDDSNSLKPNRREESSDQDSSEESHVSSSASDDPASDESLEPSIPRKRRKLSDSNTAVDSTETTARDEAGLPPRARRAARAARRAIQSLDAESPPTRKRLKRNRVADDESPSKSEKRNIKKGEELPVLTKTTAKTEGYQSSSRRRELEMLNGMDDDGEIYSSKRKRRQGANSNISTKIKSEENPEIQLPVPGKGTVPESKDSPAAAEDSGYDSRKNAPLPFLLRATLRNYQHEGLTWLLTLHDSDANGILADEMGLGKTIQTIALLAYLACYRGIWGPHLVVAPSSLVLNWESEFRRFLPGFKVLTYYGSKKDREKKRQGTWNTPLAFNVCIASYTLVLADAAAFRRKPWYYLVLDEAQHLKNHQSQKWQIMRCFNTERRLLLTGTPLQNDLTELWSLMHFLMPDLFESQADWKELFSDPLLKAISINLVQKEQDLVSRLHKILRPFLLRRLKRDVESQMPNKYEHTICCPLSRKQRALYDEFIEAKSGTVNSSDYFGLLNLLMQLRKICNHPDLLYPREIKMPFTQHSPPAITLPSFAAIFPLQRWCLSPDTLSTTLTPTHPCLSLCDAELDATAPLQSSCSRLLGAGEIWPPVRPTPGSSSTVSVDYSKGGTIIQNGGIDSGGEDSAAEDSAASVPPLGPAEDDASLQNSSAHSKRSQKGLTQSPSRASSHFSSRFPVNCFSRRSEDCPATAPATCLMCNAAARVLSMAPNALRSRLCSLRTRSNLEATVKEIAMATSGAWTFPKHPVDALIEGLIVTSTITASRLDAPNGLDGSSSEDLVGPQICMHSFEQIASGIGGEDIRALPHLKSLENSDNQGTSTSVRSATCLVLETLSQQSELRCEARKFLYSCRESVQAHQLQTSGSLELPNLYRRVLFARAAKANANPKAVNVPTEKSLATQWVHLVASAVACIRRCPGLKYLCDYPPNLGDPALLSASANELPPIRPTLITVIEKSDLLAKNTHETSSKSASKTKPLPSAALGTNGPRRCVYGGALIKACRKFVTLPDWMLISADREEYYLKDQAPASLQDAILQSRFVSWKSLFPTPQECVDRLDKFGNRCFCILPAPAESAGPALRLTHCRTASIIAPWETEHLPLLKERAETLRPLLMKRRLLLPARTALIDDCGKFWVLSQLLQKLKEGEHRCVLFTQMSKMLDILEAFVNVMNYTYVRLDGSTKLEMRQKVVEQFNADARIFLFMSSTRAGGVGLNLTGADTVIFYDTDWNPAMDRQAMDRCHRIGQTRDVHVYRLVTGHSIEENILRKQLLKRLLDDVVVDQGKFTMDTATKSGHMGVQEVNEMFKPSIDASELYCTRILHESRENDDGAREAGAVVTAAEKDFATTLAAVEDADDREALKVTSAEAHEELKEFNKEFEDEERNASEDTTLPSPEDTTTESHSTTNETTGAAAEDTTMISIAAERAETPTIPGQGMAFLPEERPFWTTDPPYATDNAGASMTTAAAAARHNNLLTLDEKNSINVMDLIRLCVNFTETFPPAQIQTEIKVLQDRLDLFRATYNNG